MLRFHSQFDSHNSIYRRSRTTCDSSCGGVKERGMEVEREGGGQYQALPKGMFPTTVKVNVDREASLDV